MRGGTFVVFNDGHAEWYALETSTTDDGDDAWLSTFHIFDNHGVRLFDFGRVSSPTLHRNPTRWQILNLYFPSYMYGSIGRASMDYHC
jgi:Family of unknown function (DUF6294)